MPAPGDIQASIALGGELGARIDAFDWKAHPLGPLESWSRPHRSMLATSLASRIPIVLWLGPELRLVYNDAYAQLLGTKHPGALGATAREVWWEIWDVIEPMLHSVMQTGVATWSDDLLLMVQRDGYEEEAYFTFTYSPIFEIDGQISGVFCAVTETTKRVLSERRLSLLREMAAALVECETVAGVASACVSCAEKHADDLPFLAFYGERNERALLTATASVAALAAHHAPTLRPWGESEPVGHAPRPRPVPAALRTDPLHAPVQALVLPVTDMTDGARVGSVVAGLNPNRSFDDDYANFCSLLAAEISAAITSARAHEAERRAADIAAELDRAKTVFFANVSHEFRTPLTLILAPLEELLADVDDFDDELRSRLSLVHGNAVRMLRLVNALLDTVHIESGRFETNLAAVDVGGLTAELVAMFESAFARAGIALSVGIAPNLGRVWLDPTMWETVVLNLVSNALKYTMRGEVSIELREDADQLALQVCDTGVGIAAGEIDGVFDRFHRSSAENARSAEGTGIGLALVKSMVEVMEGRIDVESRPGAGSTFSVRIPKRAVPPGALDSSPPARRPLPSNISSSYLAEAMRWLGSDDETAAGVATFDAEPGQSARVLVVDDNRDMREYLRRVLSAHWDVRVVASAASALEVARSWRPAVVVSDVMMPGMDGNELVAALRADPNLAECEILLLSARAGTSESLAGLESGADDYLVKPFRAVDLVRRVAARIARRSRIVADTRSRIVSDLAAQLNNVTTTDTLVSTVVTYMSAIGVSSTLVAIGDGDLIHVHDDGSLRGDLRLRYRTLGIDAPHPIADAYRDGKTLSFRDRAALAGAGFGATAHEVAPLGYEASLSIPLRSADATTTGALGLAWFEPVDFDDGLLDQFERIADVVSKTLERVRIFELERNIADTLQRELLRSDSRPRLAAVSALYRPAAAPLLVGGDWYDTLETLGGRLAMVVGDVVGSGLPAAGVMARLRATCSTAVTVSDDLEHAVAMVDAMAQRIPGATCATVVVGLLDAGGRFELCAAGHPPPLHYRVDGTAGLLDSGRSWPLAIDERPRARPIGRHRIAPGELIVFYTDGLVERRNESLDVRYAQLIDATQALGHLPTALFGERLADRLGSTDAGDDIVVLAVRAVGSTPRVHADSIACEASEIPAARHRLVAWLRQQDIDAEWADDFLLAVGEALANAIDHGNRGGDTSTVTLEVGIDDEMVVASVTDQGHWDRDTTVSAFTEQRGRGLSIMHRTVDRVDIRTGQSGTTISLIKRRAGHLA